MTILGVDYSWDRPDVHCLASHGYRFIARYLSYDTTGKNLTAAEAGAAHSAGLDIVLNWEWGKYDAREGAGLGGRQARDAGAFANHIGAPGNLPIYFSVDFDAQPHEFAAIGAYFKAANTVLGAGRVGVYAGIHLIDYLYTHRLAHWFWQTYAWSGGKVHAQAHAYQYLNHQKVCGGIADLDKALKPAFGQWAGAGSSQVIIDTPNLPSATSQSFDYTGDILATSRSIEGLGRTLDNYTSAIDQLRRI